MSIQFTKLSATGNDFILFDNRADHSLEGFKGESGFRGDEAQLFRALCARRVAIGADGILLIETAQVGKSASLQVKSGELQTRKPANLQTCHFTMRYFNRDGRESEMCGNGARAAAYYACRHQLAPAEMQFEVSGDLYHAAVAGNKVRLRMQKPRNLDLTPRALKDAGMEEGGFVNTGVPHYVLFVQDVDQVDAAKLGMKYRRHPIFQPAGTNVNFVAVDKPSHLQLRTYERGVEEETLACGTGAVASAVIAHLQKKMPFPIHVTTRGGGLTVYGDDQFEHLELEGEVRLVYHGEFDLKDFT